MPHSSLATNWYKKDYGIAILALLIVMYVARNAFPFMVYPTIIGLVVSICYTFATKREFKRPFKATFRILYPLIVLLLIEAIAFLVTLPNFGRFQMNYLKEIIFVSIYFFLLAFYLQDVTDIKRLTYHLTTFFYYFSLVFAILGIFKFFYAPPFMSDYMFFDKPMCIYGSSLVRDYNFYSLFLINGLVLGSFSLLRKPKKKRQWLYVAGLILIMTAMLMTGSRRLDVAAFLFLIILFLLIVIPPFYRKYFHSEQHKTLITYFLLLIVDLGLILTLCYFYPTQEHRVAKALGFRTERLNQNVHFVGHRFNSLVGHDVVKTTPKSGEGFTELTESRKEYWEQAVEVYVEQYTPVNKIFGKGFRYLQDFQKSNLEYNHPHFQPLSILLYSGIVGVILFIATIVYIIVLYFKHFNQLYDLFFLFLINLMFGTFSFTDAIGATFFIFTMALPLFYHYFFKKKSSKAIA